MKITFRNTLEYFAREPQKLFLIDGTGAALTTCSLFFVLKNYNYYFGMPANILTYLSVIGLVYSAYSIMCYLFLKKNWKVYLRIIGAGNFMYCALTIVLLYSTYTQLTPLGIAYFTGEILIIVLLAFLELQVSNRLK